MENKINKTSQSSRVTYKRKEYPSDATNKVPKTNASKIKPEELNSLTYKKIHKSRMFWPSTKKGDHKQDPSQNVQLADAMVEIPQDAREFVPVTSESIQRVLADLKRLESRLVLLVFDECFAKPGLSFDMIKNVVAPIVGGLDFNCVFLKTNLTQLMSSIHEADAREFRVINQAYIICPKDASEEIIAQRASERNILYGVMTSSCVVNSLKKGTLLIKKEALIAASAKLSSSSAMMDQRPFFKDNTLPVVGTKESRNNEQDKKVTAKVKWRKLKYVEQKSSTNTIVKEAEFEAKLARKVHDNVEKSDLISKILPQLTAFGDVVLRVDNLPGELTMSTLNIILGCHTLKRDQVIVVKWRRDNLDVTEAHIIVQSDRNEADKILALHNQKTINDKRLQVQRTTLKVLESYILKNHLKISRLEAERTLPFKVIGYSNTNQATLKQQA